VPPVVEAVDGTTTLVAVTVAPPETTAPPFPETAKVLVLKVVVEPVTTTGAAVASTVAAAVWVETVVTPVQVPLAGSDVATGVVGTFGKLAVLRAVVVVGSRTGTHLQLDSVVPEHGVTGVGHVGATHIAVGTVVVAEVEGTYLQVLGEAQFWQTGSPQVFTFTALASHGTQTEGPAVCELTAGV